MTRLQDMGKMALALEEQDKEVADLKLHTNSRFDQLTEMINGLSLQHSQLMSQLQTGKIEPPSSSVHGLEANHYSATRLSKLDFPRFAGDGVKDWLHRCEQFFEVDGTSDDMKLKLVVIHLEGRALHWHQSFMKSVLEGGRKMDWKEYVAAVNARFGETGFEDPMADLKNLRQIGTLGDYMNEFDAVLNKVSIKESDALSHFLGGLRTEIQLPVRMFHPTNLSQAYSLARLQESTYTALLKPGSPALRLHSMFSSSSASTYTPTTNISSPISIPNKPTPHTVKLLCLPSSLSFLPLV